MPLRLPIVNPHDVLGYPASHLRGGYASEEFRGLGVPLPPTLGENLREKPAVQALSKLGMDNYLGALSSRQAQQDYVDFYAYLHRVVDEKIGRLPGSRTAFAACATRGGSTPSISTRPATRRLNMRCTTSPATQTRRATS